MSNYYTSSFTASEEYEGSFPTSFGSNQSTEATDLSYYGNTTADTSQNYTSSEDSILQNVGYVGGSFAANAVNPNSGTESFGRSFIQTVRPYYVPQEEDRSAYEEPWTTLLHQFDPTPQNRRSSASRPRQLGHQVFPGYNVQTQTVPPLSSGSNDWLRQQHSSLESSQGQAACTSPQSLSSPSSGRPLKVAIERLPSSSNSVRSAPPVKEAELRYRCQESNCDAPPFKHLGDLKRHRNTRHCDSGPFWVCQRCGYWYPRKDKTEAHCRDIHGLPHCRLKHAHADHGCYPVNSVDDVGPQNDETKVSTTGKQTRRRRKPLW